MKKIVNIILNIVFVIVTCFMLSNASLIILSTIITFSLILYNIHLLRQKQGLGIKITYHIFLFILCLILGLSLIAYSVGDTLMVASTRTIGIIIILSVSLNLYLFSYIAIKFKNKD